MRYSSLVSRIDPAVTTDRRQHNEPTLLRRANPWEVHNRALAKQAAGDDVIVLSIGQETDQSSPTAVVASASHSLNAGRHHYADVRGTEKLREAIARYHLTLTGQAAGAEDVTVTAGAQNALFSLAQVLLESGDEAILPEPYYSTYPATFAASGATTVGVPFRRRKADGAFVYDHDAIAAAVTDRTRVIVLNSPHNPLGICPDARCIEALTATCLERGIWLVHDLVYLDIVDPGSIALPHAVPGADRILVSVGSLSKSHRMTGWRIGWAIGPAPLARHMAHLSLCMHYGLPPFVMDAAVTALEQASDTPRTVQATLDRRRRRVKQLLKPGKAVLHDTGKGMFLLLDVEPLGLDAYNFATALLESQGVALLPCDGFGPSGRYLVRLGLCVGGNALAMACARINAFISTR